MRDPMEIKEYLSYDEKGGTFTWVKRASNRKRVGEEAGCFSHAHGYTLIGFRGKILKAHKVAWLLFYGAWPEGEIDHINGDRADNRISNLRVIDRLENCRNLCRPKHNKSGVVGVTWDRGRGKWFASISVRGRTVGLGRYQEKVDAIAARKAAEMEYGFHENHGRPA